MNSYSYNSEQLEVAYNELIAHQPVEIRVTGWRAGPAYSFFNNFIAARDQKRKFGAHFISMILLFLLPSLTEIAIQSVLSKCEVTLRRQKRETYITLHPSVK